jgi:hypothetical protein
MLTLNEKPSVPITSRPTAAVEYRLLRLIVKGDERSGESQEPLTMRASDISCKERTASKQ